MKRACMGRTLHFRTETAAMLMWGMFYLKNVKEVAYSNCIDMKRFGKSERKRQKFMIRKSLIAVNNKTLL